MPRPPAFIKVCWRCGRRGTRQFIESGEPDYIGPWECANDRACDARPRGEHENSEVEHG